MKGCRFLAILLFVLLLLVAAVLLIFACSHWHNWWSLFIVPTLLVAFFSPAVCYGYQSKEEIELYDTNMDAQTFSNCRDLGWAICIIMATFAYAVPVLAWYNSSFHWGGVLCIYACLTCVIVAQEIWIAIFAFT